jgi:hypothetical protein
MSLLLTLLLAVCPDIVQVELRGLDLYVLVDGGATRLVRLAPGRSPEIVADAADMAAFVVDHDGVFVLIAPEGLGPHRLARVDGGTVTVLAQVPFAMDVALEADSIVYCDARGRIHRVPRR